VALGGGYPPIKPKEKVDDPYLDGEGETDSEYERELKKQREKKKIYDATFRSKLSTEEKQVIDKNKRNVQSHI